MKEQNNWDGKGDPEVGQFARACNKSRYAVAESFKQFIGLNVEIIGKLYHDGDLVVVINNPKYGHKSISGYEKYLEPIKSEREIAIEELIKLMIAESGLLQVANKIYDAGYRKTEAIQNND